MEPNLPNPHKIHVNGVELAYFERGQRREDLPTLFFVHATGFHARVWDYHAEAFPEHHIIALDQRGHGHSEKLAITNWRTMGEDQAAFVQALGLRDLIGIGHSMGGHGMIDGAALSGAFSRLILCDPTVPEPAAFGPEYFAMFGDELHPAAKRRDSFASPEDMIERLSTKSSFPLFTPRILKDYCEHGLEQTESGDYRLACRPEIEAHVYMSARSNGEVFDSIRSLTIPVTIIRAKLPAAGAEQDFSSSPTWPGLAAEFANARDIHWQECTHFIPMQMPDELIAIIRDEIELWCAD
jgi:pimeloyl-ACP methyl ester carboxylesterase